MVSVLSKGGCPGGSHVRDSRIIGLRKITTLALVEVPAALQTKALSLRTTPSGEIVFAIGFPMGLGKSITQGLISSNYGDCAPVRRADSSGDSGGPVLDVHVEVVGIATQSKLRGSGFPHLRGCAFAYAFFRRSGVMAV
jgi:S1-C subfamily serine protease